MAEEVTPRKFLEDNGWTCKKCNCSGGRLECLNTKDYSGYMIVIKSTIARIYYFGRVVKSSPVFDFKRIMKEQKIFPENVEA